MTYKHINDKLVHSFEKESSLGLGYGKMGFCLFCFWLVRMGYEEYQKNAENLLDDVIKKTNTINNIDIANGLAGIGLAVNHLIKEGFVEGNVNSILSDIDDIIFKHLSFQKYSVNISSLVAIQALFYLYIRLKDQEENSESKYLLQELAILTVNTIYQRLDHRFYEEPLPYTINYPFAQLLFVLSKIYELDFYNARIVKLLEEVSFKVLSTIPMLHCSRLNMLWGINAVQTHLDIKGWKHHAEMLKHEIDINHIINDELRSRNIYFNNGLTGIYFLLNHLQNYYTEDEISRYHNVIIEKIESSSVWNTAESDPIYLINNKSLFSGLSGVLLLLERCNKI